MSDNGNEPKISIEDAQVDKVVGVLFSGVDPGEEREKLIAGLFRMTITTGCGQKYHYNFREFPRQNVKCTCGKECWVVKYE